MANRVTMTICGQDYTLVADESAAYMEKVGALVDEKMTELMTSAHVSRYDAAVLAAPQGRMAMTTDGFIVSPAFSPAGISASCPSAAR